MVSWNCTPPYLQKHSLSTTGADWCVRQSLLEASLPAACCFLLPQDVSIEILIPCVSYIRALISFKFLKKIKGWAWVVLTEIIALPTWINSKAVLKVLHFSPIAPEIKFEQSVKLFLFSAVILHFHTCLKSALPLFPVFKFLIPMISLLLLTSVPKVLRHN